MSFIWCLYGRSKFENKDEILNRHVERNMQSGDTKKASVEVVLVHDGARPFVTQQMISECFELAKKGHPSIVAVPVKDTMKRVVNGVVVETPNRDEMYSVQTPQAAPTELLKKAHEAAKKTHFLGTDEASLIEKYTDIPVCVVKGAYTNIKLTTPEDLLMAEQLLVAE